MVVKMIMQNIYSKPLASGIYAGTRVQRGGGWFGRIMKSAIPFLSNIGKKVGKGAINFATDTLHDVLVDGRSIKDAAKEHGMRSLRETAKSILPTRNVANRVGGGGGGGVQRKAMKKKKKRRGPRRRDIFS